MGRSKADKDKGEVADTVAAGAIEGAGAALEAGGDPRDVAAAAIGGAAAATAEAVGETGDRVDSGDKPEEKAGTETGTETVAEEDEVPVLDPLDADAFDDRLARLVEMCEEAEFESGTLVGDIRDLLIEDAKHRPKPWSQMNQRQQGDFVRAAEEVARKIIGKVVIVLAEQDDITVHATLKGYAADGGTFKLKLVARGDMEVAQQLYALDGHEVVLISADSKRFTGQRRDPPIAPDQGALTFADPPGGEAKEEIRSDPPAHPADDSDLAGEEREEEEAEEAVGPLDKLAAGERVNVKTGMVERLVDEGGLDYEDVRDATPEELAAERERNQDFTD